MKNQLKKEVNGMPRLLLGRPNANVIMYAKFKNKISKKLLEKTIRNLLIKHKLLNCRINKEDNKLFYSIDNNIKPIITIHSDSNLQKIISNELKYVFRSEKGPLIKFGLINEENKTTLLINCHHAICDGMSLAYLLKDIQKLLFEENLENFSERIYFLESENIPKKPGNQIIRFILNLINKKWNSKNINFSNEIFSKIHNSFWSKHKPEIKTLDFSKEDTKRIIQSAKNNNVSVNTAIVTAIIKAEKEITKNKPYSNKVIVSDNLRNDLINNPEESLGYFVSALRIDMKYQDSMNFWENAREFHKKIKSKLDKNKFDSQMIGNFSPNLVDAITLNIFGYRNDSIAKKLIKKAEMDKINSSFTIANLGNLNFAGKKNLIESMHGPIVCSDTMEKYIGVLTYDQKLNIAFCYDKNIIKSNEIEKIKKEILKPFLKFEK